MIHLKEVLRFFTDNPDISINCEDENKNMQMLDGPYFIEPKDFHFPERNRNSMKHGNTGGKESFKCRVKSRRKASKLAKASRKHNRK